MDYSYKTNKSGSPNPNYVPPASVNARSKTEWISVKDRLPGRYKSCIVCSEHGNIRICYCDFNGKWFESRYNGNLVKYITHWMPLPAPPTEKEN